VFLAHVQTTKLYTLPLTESTVSTFTHDDRTQLQWYPAPKASRATRSPLHHVIPGGHILTVAVERHREALTIILREGPVAMSEVSENTKIFSADIKLYTGWHFHFCLVRGMTTNMALHMLVNYQTFSRKACNFPLIKLNKNIAVDSFILT
jgi:hypothetical protein